MEAAFHVNIIDECHVAPEPNSDISSQVTIPLTYFDIPWLFYSPNQTLFFYKIAHPESTIANLKKWLSRALHQFYPLAGSLVVPPPPAEPHILYQKGDSVPFFLAESNKQDISYLSGDHPRSVTSLSSLVPKLPSPSSVSLEIIPLFAIHVTLFGDSGLCIGVTSQHVACDERTLYAFMMCWALFHRSLLKNESFLEFFKSIPWFDRSLILDSTSLKTKLLEQWQSTLLNASHKETKHDDDVVQTTFFLSSSDINTIKDHIVAKCEKVKEDPPLNLSLYETGVCYTWICLLKVQETLDAKADGPIYMGYNASGISRLKYEIPFGYFGCCIVFGRFGALKSELVGEDGLVCATRSFDKEIDRLVRDFLEGGEKWISDWSELNLRVIGSPKVDFYGVDFGCGKAEKIEKISGDNHGRRVDVITLNGGKVLDGGLEIGVVLPRNKLSDFTACSFQYWSKGTCNKNMMHAS